MGYGQRPMQTGQTACWKGHVFQSCPFPYALVRRLIIPTSWCLAPTSSDSHKGLSAPAKVLAQPLAHGLQHDAVNLGDRMRTMEDDLLLGGVLEGDT
jgi:hypothetical protein